MSATSLGLPPELQAYMIDVGVREPDILRELRHETRPMKAGGMQISPEQGALMRLLVETLGVRRYLEIGVFTGYSSLSVALAMPPEGRIVACDVSEEWTSMAQRYWQAAGVADRIDLRIAPALQTLNGLIAENARFDFAFIDADKQNYGAYYEAALHLVRPGGLIAIDNTLWGGSVIDDAKQDDDTKAIRALNAKLAKDERITLAMTRIGDGLTLARRR